VNNRSLHDGNIIMSSWFQRLVDGIVMANQMFKILKVFRSSKKCTWNK